SHEKNQAHAIRLVRDIRNEGFAAKLLLVGDGPLRGALEQQARELGVAEHTSFLGVRPDVAAILAASDLFVLTSKSEGGPRVLIEAGMAGLGAVAYDVGAVHDIIGKTGAGLIVPEGNCEALRDAVARLLRDRDALRDMGARARESHLRTFDIGSVTEMYANLFRSLVDRRAGAVYASAR
ncbi:MAG: glycosyltransferase, partial [Chloroflexi bacterium]|nr:glycosyltransferase [Chloroflexota bacterium]